MTHPRIAALRRKLAVTVEQTKRIELERDLAALVELYPEPVEAAPVERRPVEHVTAEVAEPKRRPGRPRKNISGSGGLVLPRPAAEKD